MNTYIFGRTIQLTTVAKLSSLSRTHKSHKSSKIKLNTTYFDQCSINHANYATYDEELLCTTQVESNNVESNNVESVVLRSLPSGGYSDEELSMMAKSHSKSHD